MKKQSHILLFLACLTSMHLAAQTPNFDFIENKGQWDSQVKFVGNIGNNGAFYLGKNGFTVQLNNPADVERLTQHPTGTTAGGRKAAGDSGIIHSHVYRVSFDGANDNIEVVPDKLQSNHNNYFIGNDPTKWASDCKIYRAVLYKNVYPGIDIRYYSESGLLKYDIVVNPGADPSAIALKYEGASKLSIKNSQLYVGTSVGDVKELYPYSYQFDKVSGAKTDVSCKFEIKNGNTVRFKLKGFARDVPLVIDPVIIFSTFTGSSSDNWGFTATPGPDGSLFAGGIVLNTFGVYPVTTGAVQTSHAGGGTNWDMGITRFAPDGLSRMYSTYLGGSGSDFPLSLISDAQSNLVIMGRTYSTDFPQNVLYGSGGGSDIILTKLNPTGSAILGCLRIGGAGSDAVNVEDQRGTGVLGQKRTLHFYGDDSRGEVILDGSNNIYVVSQSQSDNLSATTKFPTTAGVFQPNPAGAQDGVILKVDPSCKNVLASTYFGGTGDDGVFVMDISPLTGHLFIAGTTFSPDLKGAPSAGVKQPTINTAATNTTDGFVAELTNDLTTVVRTTYLGTGSYDAIYGLKFDKLGYPYVMGISEGNWPVVNATYQGPAGAHQFIAKLKPDLSDFVYSTIYGTAATHPNISPVAFLVDRCENVYVSGWGANYLAALDQLFPMAGTQGMDVTPNAQKGVSDNRDFYFIVLKRDATNILYGSFFGQSGGFGEHVDGGTSRFDQQGVIYMSICANCEGNSVPGVPITQPYYTLNAVSPTNGTNGNGCNLGALKIAFNFAGVGAGVKAFINAVFDTSGCVPLTVTFKDTVRTATSYQWNFGDGSPDVFTTNFDVSHTYNAIGDYKVMLVGIDSTTCNIRDTAYTTVRVRNDEAYLSFTYAKLQPCQSLSYQFANTSTHSPTAKDFTAQSFTWDFGDGTRVPNGPSPITHSYAAAGTYNVRLILTDTNYCNAPDSTTISLRVAPLVKAQFETPATGCVPYNAFFNNTSLAGQSFSWNFGDGSTSTDINPTHLYTNPGTYIVSLVAVDTTTCNKIDSTTMTITLRSKPTAGFTYSPLTPQQNEPYTFTNTSSADAVRFVWNFGDGETLATTSRSDVDHQYNKTGTFNACLYATNDAGCTDTVCAPLQNIIVPRLDVPNAFTPLGNANNNVIYIRGFGIDKINWRIYNRFGNLVFSTSDRNQGWDGKFNGVVQPMDVYAYTLSVEFTDGTKEIKKGDITLLR